MHCYSMCSPASNASMNVIPVQAQAAVSECSCVGTGTTGTSTPRICILGGGFGGLYTAVRLESLMWPQSRRPEVPVITLVPAQN